MKRSTKRTNSDFNPRKWPYENKIILWKQKKLFYERKLFYENKIKLFWENKYIKKVGDAGGHNNFFVK